MRFFHDRQARREPLKAQPKTRKMRILELSARAVSVNSISQRMCFACGGPPSTGAGEHVIPKWLQHKFNLFNECLTLLNGTLIPYRNLTVPCCEACNNGFLSQIENAVHPIIERGTVETQDEKLLLGRWLSKILIGFLVKETGLLLDRKRPDSGPMVPAQFIEELQHCHFVLQSARKPTTFRCLHGNLPFSLYFYEVADTGGDQEFDLSTNIFGQSVAIRAGRLGVIFVSDGGLQMHAGPGGPYALSGSAVSGAQFSELAARVHYKATLRDATHFYITSENDEFMQVEQMHVESYSGLIPGSDELRIFKEWDEEALSYALAAYTRCNRSAVFDEGTKTCKSTLGTLLRDH